MWESLTFHICLSIILHVVGICLGLWIWYIFPQNPAKNVTRYPQSIGLSSKRLLSRTDNNLIVSKQEEIQSLININEATQNFDEKTTKKSSNRRFG